MLRRTTKLSWYTNALCVSDARARARVSDSIGQSTGARARISAAEYAPRPARRYAMHTLGLARRDLAVQRRAGRRVFGSERKRLLADKFFAHAADALCTRCARAFCSKLAAHNVQRRLGYGVLGARVPRLQGQRTSHADERGQSRACHHCTRQSRTRAHSRKYRFSIALARRRVGERTFGPATPPLSPSHSSLPVTSPTSAQAPWARNKVPKRQVHRWARTPLRLEDAVTRSTDSKVVCGCAE